MFFAETDTVKKSFSNTLLHPNRHYKAGEWYFGFISTSNSQSHSL